MLNTSAADQLNKRLTAAVKNRDFQVIDFDEGVVDTHAVEHAQEVFGGRDQDALAHQAGGVADLLYVAPACGDREAFEVGTDENDAGRGRGGEDTDADWNARMKSYPDRFDWTLNRSFESQEAV